MNFGVCDFSRFEVTDWRLWRWRLWFLALMTATRQKSQDQAYRTLNLNQRESLRFSENTMNLKDSRLK